MSDLKMSVGLVKISRESINLGFDLELRLLSFLAVIVREDRKLEPPKQIYDFSD